MITVTDLKKNYDKYAPEYGSINKNEGRRGIRNG